MGMLTWLRTRKDKTETSTAVLDRPEAEQTTGTPVAFVDAETKPTIQVDALDGYEHEEPEELLVAPGQRAKRLARTDVPLAYVRSRVAGVGEELGEEGLGDRGARVLVRFVVVWVVYVTEALLIAAGKDARTRGAAVRMRDVALGEPHARPRQRVDVQRPETNRTLHTDVGVAEVIDENDQDVGTSLP